jgi:hypothetical protein
MELPNDYMTPLLPVMGILVASLQGKSAKLISKLKEESWIELVNLKTNWLFHKPDENNSPNNIHSPLYPDGIMSPLWIQKVKSNPGVVLGIYDLSLDVKGQNDPLNVGDTFRENDANTCLTINEKRKSLAGDRGRKFIPLFILYGLEEKSTSYEERLAYIRKTCGSEKIFTIHADADDDEIKKFIKG